jgi:dual specificity phosphatase 12
MHKVSDYLYIGNRRAGEKIKILQSEGISKVLQLLDFYIPPDVNSEIEVHFIQMEDSENQSLSRILPEALRYIHRAICQRQKILVHCNAGVSRSGSVLIAYLMACLRISFSQALAIAQEARACIDPNPGFTKQLNSMDVNYLNSLIN